MPLSDAELRRQASTGVPELHRSPVLHDAFAPLPTRPFRNLILACLPMLLYALVPAGDVSAAAIPVGAAATRAAWFILPVVALAPVLPTRTSVRVTGLVASGVWLHATALFLVLLARAPKQPDGTGGLGTTTTLASLPGWYPLALLGGSALAIGLSRTLAVAVHARRARLEAASAGRSRAN